MRIFLLILNHYFVASTTENNFHYIIDSDKDEVPVKGQ